MGDLVFILGPARSGKSRLAEQIAAEYGAAVLYLATLQPADAEMEQRVAAHRAARPAHWTTVEEPLDLVSALSNAGRYDACLLDCVTLWVTNLMLASDPAGEDADVMRPAVLDALQRLLDWQAGTAAPLVAVSNEVGGGIVPAYALGRAFRDILGEANQVLAGAASRFYYTLAGHYVDMSALGARRIGDFVPHDQRGPFGVDGPSQ